MDPETLRKVAKLVRSRARPPRQYDRRDGLERLGAERALEQLAKDLEFLRITAGNGGRTECGRHRSAVSDTKDVLETAAVET